MKCVAVLFTGGTIGGVRQQNGAVNVAPDPAGSWLDDLAEKTDVLIEPKYVLNKLSEDFEPSDWMSLARAAAVELARKEIDGVVILHGTFTMSYTAAALAFSFLKLSKPIVLTGAQKPFSEAPDHVRRNLWDSIRVAAYGDIAEVLVVFSADAESRKSNVYRGVRVQKQKARSFDAFEGVYSEPIMHVADGALILRTEEFEKRSEQFIRPVFSEFDRRVLCLRAFPGFDASWIVRLGAAGVRGIIVQGYSDGAVSTANNTVLEALRVAREMGVFVGFVSQAAGAVTLIDYSSGVNVRRSGGVPLGDINVDTAVVKLMWCLGRSPENLEAVRREMVIPFCREITLGSEAIFDQ